MPFLSALPSRSVSVCSASVSAANPVVWIFLWRLHGMDMTMDGHVEMWLDKDSMMSCQNRESSRPVCLDSSWPLCAAFFPPDAGQDSSGGVLGYYQAREVREFFLWPAQRQKSRGRVEYIFSFCIWTSQEVWSNSKEKQCSVDLTSTFVNIRCDTLTFGHLNHWKRVTQQRKGQPFLVGVIIGKKEFIRSKRELKKTKRLGTDNKIDSK